MKAKTFENLIRKVVREEIDYSLRREIKTLKEDLRDELKPITTERIEKGVHVDKPRNPGKPKLNLREKIMGKKPIKQHTPKNYTSNSTLNDLLNETAQGDTNTSSANTPVNMAQPLSSTAPMSADTVGMPDVVANAMTRDYSGLMKAIDKKKRG